MNISIHLMSMKHLPKHWKRLCKEPHLPCEAGSAAPDGGTVMAHFSVTTPAEGESKINLHVNTLGLGIGCNFMIDNQLQPTDRLSIIISSSHFCSNWVLEV